MWKDCLFSFPWVRSFYKLFFLTMSSVKGLWSSVFYILAHFWGHYNGYMQACILCLYVLFPWVCLFSWGEWMQCSGRPGGVYCSALHHVMYQLKIRCLLMHVSLPWVEQIYLCKNQNWEDFGWCQDEFLEPVDFGVLRCIKCTWYIYFFNC